MPVIAMPAMSFGAIPTESAAAASAVGFDDHDSAVRGDDDAFGSDREVAEPGRGLERFGKREQAAHDEERRAQVCDHGALDGRLQQSDRRTPGTCSEIRIKRPDSSSCSRAIARPTAGRSTSSRVIRSRSGRNAGVNVANNRRRSTDRPSASTAVARSPKESRTPDQPAPSGRIIRVGVVNPELLAIHRRAYFEPPSSALTYSRVIRAIFEIGISFGHTASHSPSFEQLPKPSASARAIIATTRWRRST